MIYHSGGPVSTPRGPWWVLCARLEGAAAPLLEDLVKNCLGIKLGSFHKFGPKAPISLQDAKEIQHGEEALAQILHLRCL